MVKKTARIFAIIFVSIVLLNTILFITFSIAPIQKWAADIVLQKLNPVVGSRASLDGVRIRLFNTVELMGLFVEDQQQDTLLYAESIKARISTADLLREKLTLKKVGLENFKVNIYRETTESQFNFQFLIDAFSKEGECEGEEVKKDKKLIRIVAENLILKNGRVDYNIQSAPDTPGEFNINHISLQNLNFKGNVDYLSLEDMSAELQLLTFLEANSGVTVSHFEADIHGNKELLKSNKFNINLNNSTINIEKALFDRELNQFSVALSSEELHPKDMAMFYSPIAKLDKELSLELEADGRLPQLNLNRLELKYGEDVRLDINGAVYDYSNIYESDLTLDLKRLSLSQPELESIISLWAPDYQSPEELIALGDMELRLQAKGRIEKFNYDGNIKCEQGDIVLNGLGSFGRDFENISFEGPVTLTNIQTANIIGEKAGVGNATIYADTKVTIPRGSHVTVTTEADIKSVLYRDYLYNDIYLNGKYSGNNVSANISIDSQLNRFDLSGDFTFGDYLELILDADIERLDLRPFLMMKNWRSPMLTTRVKGKMSGSSIDDMAGRLVIDNSSLVDSSFIYNPGPIYLQAFADEGEEKRMHLISNFLEVELNGDYYFSSIAEELKRTLQPHLPSIIDISEDNRSQTVFEPQIYLATSETEEQMETNWLSGQELGNNRFNFKLLIKNSEDISHTFGLPLYNVDQAVISGNVDMAAENSINISADIPRLMFGNSDIRETKMMLQRKESGLSLELNSYLAQDNGYINAELNTEAFQDSVFNRILFTVNKTNNKSEGELLITMALERDQENRPGSAVLIHPSRINFNGKEIDVNEATIDIHNERIDISNFGIHEKDMLLLGIEGVASKSEADNIRIYFNNTELDNILTPFNIFNLTGSINGDIFIRQALETPMIRTEELRIEDITLYNDTIGTLLIYGDWDQIYSGLNLNAHLINEGERSLNIEGYIPTGDESPFPMDMKILLENLELSTIKPFTADALSILSGRLNSNIKISGSFTEPITEGWLGIDDGAMRVAYTNVTYNLSDTIWIGKDNVGLENLVIRDQNNNSATLNISLLHTNFGRMVYSADMKLDDFMLLNNRDRTDQMVYGDLRLSGRVNLTGSAMGIYGDADLTTQSASEVTVVLPQTAKAIEYSGVVYIDVEETDPQKFLITKNGAMDQVSSNNRSGMPIVMRGNLNLNQLLRAAVILDPTTDNSLDVSGDGEININFNSKSTPELRLYGDYIINSGKFHYNLQNLQTIDFIIRQGSKLIMEGDPMNTQFNIAAYLPVRADLSTLNPTFSTELANTRVPVNALLQIRGNLEAMDLKYDIELPECSKDVQQRVNSFINDEETKILQFAYLATTGSFIPFEGSSDMNFGTSMFSKFAASRLSRGLDALFANALSDNWLVSTNLESTDGTFENVRMGVDVSTRLLNNRLRMSTNLSYGDNSMLATNQAFMGEFEFEYDINSWFMFRGYNRANDRFYRRTPTTQGIGVMVTKEAKSLRDLFNFRFIRPKRDEE